MGLFELPLIWGPSDGATVHVRPGEAHAEILMATAEPHRWAVYRLRSGASRRWYQFATWHIESIFDGSDRA